MVTKAIIAAGGLGTRFLPTSKVTPKELIHFIDKPIIQYSVEECKSSGINEIIVVTREENSLIEKYFTSDPELERYLENKNKPELLEKVRNINSGIKFIFVKQDPLLPYGTASILETAKPFLNQDDDFALIYGDDIFVGENTYAIRELIDLYLQNKDKVLGVMGGYELPLEELKKYGVFSIDYIDNLQYFAGVIEKPKDDQLVSNIARVGRFVYNYKLFDYFNFDFVKTNPRGEYELTDIENEAAKYNKFLISDIKSKWYPVGDIENYLRSTVEFIKNSKMYNHLAKS